jgi:hypothetical protein
VLSYTNGEDDDQRFYKKKRKENEETERVSVTWEQGGFLKTRPDGAVA